MQKEAQEYVKKCDQCQKFAPNIHQPGGVLNLLSSPWPFAQWGLDIVGPFHNAARNKRYLLLDTDYFTKWVVAEPLANIRDVDAKRFVWKNIGIPSSWIMVFSLIAKFSEDTVVTWGLQIDIPPWLIYKGMDK